MIRVNLKTREYRCRKLFYHCCGRRD